MKKYFETLYGFCAFTDISSHGFDYIYKGDIINLNLLRMKRD